jgi:tryptophan synthase beta chain
MKSKPKSKAKTKTKTKAKTKAQTKSKIISKSIPKLNFKSETRILLPSSEMPKQWYNIQPDLPRPCPPPLHPVTHQICKPEDLAPIFAVELLKQEVSQDRWIDIPEELQDIYRLWRPTPMHRAYRLEKLLDTPAKIYYKNESVSPAGSHKPNSAVAQAYYNKKQGIKRLTTETGAGQWGSALSMACNLFGLECVVYMVKCSYEQKPFRRIMMETWKSKVIASPSNLTESGRKILAENPKHPGTLGVAISEAVEDAMQREDTHYTLGSVLNHVLLHQTIIGLEAKQQMEMAGDYPDVVIGCVGGGSNFSGFAFPFIHDRLAKKHAKTRYVAVEPSACPTMTRGKYAWDYGDTAKMAPVALMHTLGHTFVPDAIHAGGLRYHGNAPLLSILVDEKIVEPRAYDQIACFEAAVMFARSECIIPAPETSHAIRAAIDEALRCKREGKAETIVFNLSGHGHFDLTAYDKYLTNQMQDVPLDEKKLQEALNACPEINLNLGSGE